MPTLIIKNLDEEIINALEARAAQHHRTIEAEHRAILVEVLQKPIRKTFLEALACMPNVGMDSDFKRISDDNSAFI
jgi:antitoxin FitA